MFERPPVPDRPGDGRVIVLASVNFGEPDYAENLAEMKLLASGAGL